jgi:cell division protein FtsN
MRDQQRAQELAQTIEVEGVRAKVTSSVVEGVPIYRVVLGPYPTRAEAERVARASGKGHWIYDGTP